jgi:hypothetical protein
VLVDVKLAQDTGGADNLLRMIEFDLQDTNLTFLTVELPTTHDLGTSLPGQEADDIKFWSFDSLDGCRTAPGDCGFRYYVDDDLPPGPVDTRNKVLSIAYYGLSFDTPNQYQILLPGSGVAVTVGKLKVTMPSIGNSTQTLNLRSASWDNTNDPNGNRGARVDFGFPTHIIWRARSLSPNNVSGGTLGFTVCDSDPCQGGGPGPSVTKWESVLTHGATVGAVAVDIPNTGAYSESRSGIKKIVVTFDGALNPATAIPGNLKVCGKNVANSPVDLSGVTITTATTTGDIKMEIIFTPGLPDYARYRIELGSSIQGTGGGAIQAGTGGLSRILTALLGDVNADRRTNATDLGAVRNFANLAINPIDPATLLHVRSDVNNDGRINATDVGATRAKVTLANDARLIEDPAPFTRVVRMPLRGGEA